MAQIKSLKAKEIKDSRGNPTLEVFVGANGNLVSACVPSGASTGILEAKEIEVSQAIENIEKVIAPNLIGKNPFNQVGIDNLLINIDATPDKSKLGGNTIVGISMAITRLSAQIRKVPLYKHISELFGDERIIIPRPCFNIINGGAHAQNDLAIQEFMIVPKGESFEENLAIGKQVFKKLGEILKEKFGNIEVGDEGGYAPPISSTKTAIEYILKADADDKTELILDCAASQFYKPDVYSPEGEELTKNELVEYYQNLVSEYPIIGLEDPMAENDWQGFEMIFRELGDKIIIIGDDLLVTNPARIQEAAEKTACNGVIIKVNQIGTVSEAIKAVKVAKEYKWKTMVSHRSGETMDDFIADFAVGSGSDFIKSGAPGPAERMVKYNRLLQISNEI
ncbi:enolase [Patescibacteria group bacterium]|nr:enolase [Patescibacteria group bacterium]MBU4023294.1 enolase [Patescibacteria group bacterium]